MRCTTDGLNQGRINSDRLPPLLAGLPLPRFPDGRLVLAVDVSPWPWPDAPCSPDRLFCHVDQRTKTASPSIPGRPYSFVAALEMGRHLMDADPGRGPSRLGRRRHRGDRRPAP
ncbi:transposase [Streptomyces uncialis]|uniref:transposase n=1 Tax=Streptomyces uncialis TaxID=1048205 RepID=UPI00386BA75A